MPSRAWKVLFCFNRSSFVICATLCASFWTCTTGIAMDHEVAFFTNHAHVYRVQYHNGINVTRASIASDLVDIDGSRYLKFDKLPPLPASLEELNVVSIAGAAWMETGIVLLLTVKDKKNNAYS